MPPQGTVSAPRPPAGTLTPGGAILSSPGSIHAFSDDGNGGDCCTTCRPSILERIKGIFQVPKADTQKPDPLQNPAAYSPSRATAELAGVGTAPTAPKGDTPLNAFTGPKTPVAPSTPISAMGGDSFGPIPYAAGTVAAVFHQGAPNMSGYSSPAMATTGPPTQPVVHVINKKRLKLNFEVKDVGPSGVSGVELWYTRDGKDWRKGSELTNPHSPITFRVADEGLYGFTLIVHLSLIHI